MNIKIFGFGIFFILIISSISATAGCIQEDTAKTEDIIDESTNIKNNYIVVDTGQNICYDHTNEISCPQPGESFYGQDAQYFSTQPSYQYNGDGTVTDLNTDLMWQQDPGSKKSYDGAVSELDNFHLAGYNDWRLPTIKELYSLIDFRGTDPSGFEGDDTSNLIPFINTDYFEFEYGDTSADERIIDSQYGSSIKSVSGTGPNNDETLFGVNFADGRIKGYGMTLHGSDKTFFFMYVRGDSYGVNDFTDNGDGTVTDSASGLMWQQVDGGGATVWEDALDYAENLDLAGYSDWRLPNAKELQYIVDYSKSPDATSSAAIDSVFDVTEITNEAGEIDYSYYWSSTTHSNYLGGGSAAAYIAFGRAMGYMDGQWVDAHGAGAQRSDPKTGDPGDYPYGHGPQGDAIRIFNYVRCVRGGLSDNQPPNTPDIPDGPSSGKHSVEHNYTTSTSDPNSDQIYYWFDWGDDSNSGWLGPFNSGGECTGSHTWTSQGTYEIRVKAKDSNGAQSEWSDPLSISMPKTKLIGNINHWIFRLTQRFPILEYLL